MGVARILVSYCAPYDEVQLSDDSIQSHPSHVAAIISRILDYAASAWKQRFPGGRLLRRKFNWRKVTSQLCIAFPNVRI